MPAIREEIEEAHHEGIEFLYQRQPIAFHGNGRVAEVELAEVAMGEPDGTGRRRPIVGGDTSRLECDHVLLALGQSADKSVLPPDGEIVQGRVCTAAGITNLFVAGDFSTGEGTVAHAIGDGRRVARAAMSALGEDVPAFIRPDRADAVPVTAIRLDHFPAHPPTIERQAPVAERVKNFDESTSGLQDVREAERCFSCGHCTHCDTCMVYCPEGIITRTSSGYGVDLTFCKGCGICVVECPRDAMEMLPS